jgi:hypothetical protein
MAFGVPLDAPVLYSYAKDNAGSTGTVIVDDAGELGSRGVFSDLQPHQMASFQQLSQPVQYGNEVWQSTLNHTASYVHSQLPISPPLEPQYENKENGGIPVTSAAVDAQWGAGLDLPMPSNLTTSFPSISHGLGIYDESQQPKSELENGTRSPSLREDVSKVFESSYSVTNDSVGAFADRQVKEEDTQGLEWNDSSDDASREVSPVFPKISAFMVSQDSSDLPSTTFASNPSATSAARGARHIPLALQPASVARKRKQRNSVMSVEQINQPKPLQIVQEDGLGGSISSEDFVSPPRGARRKGPLSTVGRANAGMRRKNKDTCVQCRLNKRKVLSEYFFR